MVAAWRPFQLTPKHDDDVVIGISQIPVPDDGGITILRAARLGLLRSRTSVVPAIYSSGQSGSFGTVFLDHAVQGVHSVSHLKIIPASHWDGMHGIDYR